MIIIVCQVLKIDIYDDIIFMYITIQYFLFLLVVAFMKNLSQSNTLSSFKFLYMGQTTTISADISLAGQNASHKLLASWD